MAEKTYKNISNAPVLGNAPGKVFKVDPEKLPEGQLKRMIARHSIEEVDPSALTEVKEVAEGEEFAPAGDDKNKPEEKKDQGQTPGPKSPPVQKRS